ncbi:MAG: hypothetical protein AAFO07_24940, partial [Bacteroidota bacterium]
MPKQRMVNCHAHVFTGNFVPPFLGKTLVPWPFYYLIHTGSIVWLVKTFFRIKYYFGYTLRYSKSFNKLLVVMLWNYFRTKFLRLKYWILGNYIIRIPFKFIVFWLTIIAAIYLIDYLTILFKIDELLGGYVTIVREWLKNKYLYYELEEGVKILWIITIFLFLKSSRKPILFIVKSIFPAIKKIFSHEFQELIERYYLLGRFATTYKTQARIALRALHQLPAGSSMVLLPMDMEYMKAGKTYPSKYQKEIAKKYATNNIKLNWKASFRCQMLEIWDFVKNDKENAPKSEYYPFLFLDPRRIKEEGKVFFDWEWSKDEFGKEISKIKLKECFVKTYMEDRRFSGFKIYPALGYHCFDEYLLPIWRYAAENHIPIMTHCVIGRIYYRGTIKANWHFHPVFKEDNSKTQKLLPETKNGAFQRNFTHPLNYLCLLEPDLLKLALDAVTDENKKNVWKAFRKDPNAEELDFSILKNLKICLAHYGGEDEWIRYMEQDREPYSQRLMRDILDGINFIKRNEDGDISWAKINQIWERADWYSIISSLLIKYNNIYSDLSYILSKESVYPLVKYTLEKADNFLAEHEDYLSEQNIHLKGIQYTGKNKLRSRVLFGTDFYVVRNHKSEKNLFVDLKT